MNEKVISEVMREMGRRGGKKRLESMTPEERSAVAKKAAAKSAIVRSKKAAGKSKAVQSKKAAAKKLRKPTP